jgi:hypothetical protein
MRCDSHVHVIGPADLPVQAPTNYELVIRAMAFAAAVVGDDGVGAVLAAPDLAAERHRAAALDCAHHLQLVADDLGVATSRQLSGVHRS